MSYRILHIISLTVLLLLATVESHSIFTKFKTPDYYESNIREHFKHDRWKEGKKLLDEGWKAYGDLSVMNELMGRYYYHFKVYDKARFYLVRSLRDDNTNTQARETIVNVEEETHNYSSAICYINELLERNPYSMGWWRRKINIYRKQGNHEEANRLLARLRQIYPNDEQVTKDIAYVNEQKYIQQKRDGNINGQLETLQNLVKAYPNNPEYYFPLCNILLQSGRTNEAAELAGKGARLTGSVGLMRKRAGILAERGYHAEAINYLKECMKMHHGVSFVNDIRLLEKDAAQNAMLNDPYTAMARVYATQHDSEALQFLLNTSIARGYYDDALTYIAEAKKGGKANSDLLYKEFIVNKRLGNKNTAYGILARMYELNPNNEDVKENFSQMKYENAVEQMNLGQYAEAIPELQFIMNNAIDVETRYGAAQRLFNCHFELKQYDVAQKLLDILKDKYEYKNYVMQSAAVAYAAGRTEIALELLVDEYHRCADSDTAKARLIAYQYEEYVLPYVKNLMSRGMTRVAYKTVKEALLICPTSNALLHNAIATSDILGYKKDYEQMVYVGRQEYPEDPFFIVKEASISSAEGDNSKALAMLRPQLEIYPGDSTLVRAFSEYSRKLANEQAKKKAYNSAIATLDTALYFNQHDWELLYAKGVIYEYMHELDSAYQYQRAYKPTLMDYREHSRHQEELLSMNYNNNITMTYQQARPGSEDVISSNASVEYLMRRKRNEFTFSVHYAGRDGVSEENRTVKDMESGGTGIMLGADWRHSFDDSPWAFSVGGAWASKYFPEITLRATLEREVGDGWTLNAHASYRRIQTFIRSYGWTVNTEKVEETDPDMVYVANGWLRQYKGLTQLGIGVQRTLGQFFLQGSVDGFLMADKVYYNGQLKGQFFPFEGTRTHCYTTLGVGNAPQTELLDQSMPAGFSKLNTFVGAGAIWYFNRHIAAALSGTWYTIYRSQDVQTGIWGGDNNVISSSTSTDYKNMFYIQGQIVLSF